MRIGSNAASFVPRLQALATEVAPALQLLDVRTVDDAAWDKKLSHTAMFWLMLVAGGLAVLLSTASIYAIMSFSVSRRTREIGIRVALGATRFQVASAVLSRLSWQIAFGVLAGGVISLLMHPPPLTATYAGLFGGYLTAMICVCLLACLVPTSRALRIEPTQALKEEA